MSRLRSLTTAHDHRITHATLNDRPLVFEELLQLPERLMTQGDVLFCHVNSPEDIDFAWFWIMRWLSVEGWHWLGANRLSADVRKLTRTCRVRITIRSYSPGEERRTTSIWSPLWMSTPTVPVLDFPGLEPKRARRLALNLRQRSRAHHYSFSIEEIRNSDYTTTLRVRRQTVVGSPQLLDQESIMSFDMFEMTEIDDLSPEDRKLSSKSEIDNIIAQKSGRWVNATQHELGLASLRPWTPVRENMPPDDRLKFDTQGMSFAHEWMLIPGYARRRAIEVMSRYSKRHTTRTQYSGLNPRVREARIAAIPEAIERRRAICDEQRDRANRKAKLELGSAYNPDMDYGEQYTMSEDQWISFIEQWLETGETEQINALSGLSAAADDEPDMTPEEAAILFNRSRDPRNNTMFWYIPLSDLLPDDMLDYEPGDDRIGIPTRLRYGEGGPILAIRVPVDWVFTVRPATNVAHEYLELPPPQPESDNARFHAAVGWLPATEHTETDTRGRPRKTNTIRTKQGDGFRTMTSYHNEIRRKAQEIINRACYEDDGAGNQLQYELVHAWDRIPYAQPMGTHPSDYWLDRMDDLKACILELVSEQVSPWAAEQLREMTYEQG